jgi:hypothetical protein
MILNIPIIKQTIRGPIAILCRGGDNTQEEVAILAAGLTRVYVLWIQILLVYNLRLLLKNYAQTHLVRTLPKIFWIIKRLTLKKRRRGKCSCVKKRVRVEPNRVEWSAA